jgi:hypothetical protein
MGMNDAGSGNSTLFTGELMGLRDMELNRSLEFIRFILRAVYEGNIKSGSELSNFLLESNFFASVFSAIMTVDNQLRDSVEKELIAFLAKAEEFGSKKAEFAQFWPYEGGTKIFLAFQNIVAKKAGDGELFTVIIGIIREALNIIKDYDAFYSMRNLYLEKCGI